MKSLLLAAVIAALVFSSASAHQHRKHHGSVTTGQSSNTYGYSSPPQSPLSYSSGAVTHSDEQARGLVPGNTNADGGMFRNLSN